MRKTDYLEYAKELEALDDRSINILTKSHITYPEATTMFEKRKLYNAYQLMDKKLLLENNLVSPSDFPVF